MARLTTYVHVPDDEGGYTVFGPDDDVPEPLARRIGEHAWEGGEPPYPSAPSAARESGSPPPMGGPGSGTEAWALYASEQGVDVEDGATRQQIIDALVEAGKPVELQR